MITGGTSWNALTNGAHSGGPSPDYPSGDLTYDEHGALGIFPRWVLDTHFSERGREGRLIRLVFLVYLLDCPNDLRAVMT